MGAVGHCEWLILAEPGHAALPVAPVMGALAVVGPRFSSSTTRWRGSPSSWTSSWWARCYATTVVVARWGAVHGQVVDVLV